MVAGGDAANGVLPPTVLQYPGLRWCNARRRTLRGSSLKRLLRIRGFGDLRVSLETKPFGEIGEEVVSSLEKFREWRVPFENVCLIK